MCGGGNSIPAPPRLVKLPRQKKHETYITSAYNVLPPCNVCGEKSSGMHYGVNTCEGCKGFFRRCNQKSVQDFQCIFGDGECNVRGNSRNKCQYCRYRKCVAVGMSKGAIKIGRYTKELKIRNLEQAQRVNQMCSAVELMEYRGENSNQSWPSDVKECGGECTPPLMPFTESCMTVADQWISAENSRLEFVRQLVLHTLKSHRQTTLYADEHIPAVLAKQRQTMKLFNVIGQTEAVNYVDELSMPMQMEKIHHLLGPGLQQHIQFGRLLPGFVDLPQDDQQTLIRGAVFESWMLVSCKTFTTQYMVYDFFDGLTVQANPKYQELYSSQLWQFDFAARTNELQLNDLEIALVRALVFFQPEREGLSNPDMVSLTRHQYLMALYVYLADIAPLVVMKKMAKLLSLVDELFQFGEKVSNCYYSLRLDAADSDAERCTPDSVETFEPMSPSHSTSGYSSASVCESFHSS